MVMVQDLAAPVDTPWAAYEWLQAASDASGTLNRRESVPTCRSFAAEVELYRELFPSSVSQRMKRSSLISRGSVMAQER
jgi:hypothetical protein